MKKTVLQRKMVVNGEQLKANRMFAKRKRIMKKLVSISVAVSKISKSQEEEEDDERVDDGQVVQKSPLKLTHQQKLVGMYVDDPEVKRTLSNWRVVKQVNQHHNPENIQNSRAVARQNLEKIQNTARLTENMDSMDEFYKLIGYPS